MNGTNNKTANVIVVIDVKTAINTEIKTVNDIEDGENSVKINDRDETDWTDTEKIMATYENSCPHM